MSPSMKKVLRVTVATTLLLAGVVVAVALGTLGLEWRKNAAPECRVAAFMYHSVIPDSLPGQRFDIRHSDFKRHLGELDEAGVRVVDPLISESATGSMADAIEAWCSQHDRVAMITFDAETPSHHATLSVPELRARDMTAAYFVVTDFLDASNWVSRSDIEVMLEAGMRVGSHSHRHPLMTRIPPSEVREDLSASVAVLGELAATGPPMLALPGGRYDPEVLRIAGDIGFSQIFTSDPCYVKPTTPSNRICRIEVRGDRGPSPLEFLDSPFLVSRQGWSWGWKRRIEGLTGVWIWDLISRMRYG